MNSSSPHPRPRPPRFNPWPVGLTLFFIAFISVTIAFVVMSTRQRTDLVTPDYYERDLLYQEQIDREQRTRAAQLQVGITHDPATGRLRIALPAAHAVAQPRGTIHLYRPAAAELDREFELEVDGQGQQVLDAGNLAAGLWRVRVRWAIGELEFEADERLVIERAGAASRQDG